MDEEALSDDALPQEGSAAPESSLRGRSDSALSVPYWAIVAFTVLACFSPFLWAAFRSFHSSPHPWLSLSPNWEVWGAWISGVTTPILVFVAIITFAKQRESDREQQAHTQRQISALITANKMASQNIAALRHANRIADRSAFIQNITFFEEKIDFLCEASLWNELPIRKIRSNLTNVEKLAKVLTTGTPQQDGLSRLEIQQSVFYQILTNFLDDIRQLSGNTPASILSLQIIVLLKAIEKFPPVKNASNTDKAIAE